MEDLSDQTLDQLLQKAQELNVLDGWEKVNGSVVFQLANKSIAIRESFAKTFARGLLRGFELGATLEENPGKGEGNTANDREDRT